MPFSERALHVRVRIGVCVCEREPRVRHQLRKWRTNVWKYVYGYYNVQMLNRSGELDR